MKVPFVIPAKAGIQSRTLDSIEAELDKPLPSGNPAAAEYLLGLAEETLEAWVAARGQKPTDDEREGFRLLALHHQGAVGVPSFNACRETCREIAYHYNLLSRDELEDTGQRLKMMGMLVRHLTLFVGGKLQVEGLGEFCCASKPLRQNEATIATGMTPD
ncbi:MAG: hypothetical protein ACXWHZ_01925 [Usitatibacter sp.]